MNIVRALDVALPELPERVIRKNPPKLDPRVISKEHIEKGQPVVLVKMPGTDLVFRFAPIQWKLIQMFDGIQTQAEIAQHFLSETGSMVSEEDVKELASFLQSDTQLLDKSGRYLVACWFLFGTMAAIHGTAHGMVGTLFGATIEKMGFCLLYFAPTFLCDATQVWVVGGKWARIATSIAGIWLDLVVCFLATVVWWGTPSGMSVHDWAYKVMLVTGIGVSVLNLNPLIKLDGYLIFSELVAEPSLKESSTAYLSGWVRKRIFRLPVEVPYVPRRIRVFYVTYGVLSGIYSYSLLSFLMVITYHILRSYSPAVQFIPPLPTGYFSL